MTARRRLLYLAPGSPAPWRAAVAGRLPDAEFVCWSDTDDYAGIDYCLAWKPPQGVFNKITGLKAIFALGAGVERILDTTDMPQHVPVVRLADSDLIADMAEYVLAQCLYLHREMPAYRAQQTQGEWRARPAVRARERRVTVLGLGSLGAAAAVTLAQHGFSVSGWSRSDKTIPSVECLSGAAALKTVLERTDILVNLLPLTSGTRRLLDAEKLAWLKLGATIVSAGRGAVIDEEALAAALDRGALDHAVLDVFETEPLPADHPFWRHARVTVTPHVASETNPRTAVAYIAQAIERFEGGEALPNVVDWSRGY